MDETTQPTEGTSFSSRVDQLGAVMQEGLSRLVNLYQAADGTAFQGSIGRALDALETAAAHLVVVTVIVRRAEQFEIAEVADATPVS